MIEAMLLGVCRVECVEGRLVRRSLHESLPDPTEDPIVGPHWKEAGEPKFSTLTRMEVDRWMDPSIVIQNLCGYYWSEENYAKQAKTLERFGFTCLRSRRGADGNYWEIWYLPGFWAAEGELRDVIERSKYEHTNDLPELYRRKEEQMTKVSKFLCRSVTFGAMDFNYQRAAMGPPEE